MEVPVLLPMRKDLLKQPHFHRNLHTLDLTGFRIVSDPRATSASLREWRANLPSADAFDAHELSGEMGRLSLLVQFTWSLYFASF